VEYVEISRNAVKITLRYPSNSDDYEPLIKELIETKLVEQIKRVNPYLREGTEGVLRLDDQVEFEKIIDDVSGKRSLPPDVLTELKGLLGKISPPSLRDSDVTPCGTSIPEPTELFTGMEQKKTEFRDLLANSNLISVEGLGGVGKTEFVLKCIEQFLPKEKVVWFECLPDSKVDALIGLSGYPEVLKGENKTEIAKYSGFIDLIEKDEKTLFLDNFQSITGNSFEELLKFTERRLKKDRIGVDKNPTAGSITQIRRELGLKKFRETFQLAYDSLAKDLQTHVYLEEFTEDKTVVRGREKVGRNNPCPCGSGKKYKKCCGK
jgi:SEC-C motif